MTKRQVFYSFHYANDCRRVQQIRNMNIFEGTKELAPNKWEEIKRSGDANVRKWIDKNLRYRSCTIVLIGEKTADRKWVKYEIKRSWELGKGVVGVDIHKLKDLDGNKSRKGRNPFNGIVVNGVELSKVVPIYDPQDTQNCSAYNDIKNNILQWTEEGIIIRQAYPGCTQYLANEYQSSVKNTNGSNTLAGILIAGALGFIGLLAYSKLKIRR